MRTAIVCLLLGAGLPVSQAQPAPGQDSAPQPGAQPPLLAALRTEVAGAFDAIAAGDDPAASLDRVQSAFDAVIAYGRASETAAFREAAAAVRLVRLVERAPDARRPAQLQLFRDNAALASAVAFTLGPHDDAARALVILDQLRRTRPQAVADYPYLAAAIAAVHDQPPPRAASGAAAEPTALLDHFAANAARLVFPPHLLPPELAVYLVDTPASAAELAWGFTAARGEGRVERHYFAVPLDAEHASGGAPKRIQAAGYTLQNLASVGGDWGDQAYFAAAVAEANGIPAAIIAPAHREAGLAGPWVGYLERLSAGAVWDFDRARHPEFPRIAGAARDPQTGQTILAATLSITADLAGRSPEDRETAIALADAALRLTEIADSGSPFPPPPPAGVATPSGGPRTTEISSRLALLDAAVSRAPGCLQAWRAVIALSDSGAMADGDRRAWVDRAAAAAGRTYPDFVLWFAGELLADMQPGAERDRTLKALERVVPRRRADLEAEFLLLQARLAGEGPKALAAYQALAARHESPLALAGLAGAERILKETKREGQALSLWGSTWKQARPPKGVASHFVPATTWYRIGEAYAERLRAAGRESQADGVVRELAAAAGQGQKNK